MSKSEVISAEEFVQDRLSDLIYINHLSEGEIETIVYHIKEFAELHRKAFLKAIVLKGINEKSVLDTYPKENIH